MRARGEVPRRYALMARWGDGRDGPSWGRRGVLGPVPSQGCAERLGLLQGSSWGHQRNGEMGRPAGDWGVARQARVLFHVEQAAASWPALGRAMEVPRRGQPSGSCAGRHRAGLRGARLATADGFLALAEVGQGRGRRLYVEPVGGSWRGASDVRARTPLAPLRPSPLIAGTGGTAAMALSPAPKDWRVAIGLKCCPSST